MVDSMAVDVNDKYDNDEEQVDDTALEKARIGTRREEARMVNASAIEDTFICSAMMLEIRHTYIVERGAFGGRERWAGKGFCVELTSSISSSSSLLSVDRGR